MAADVEQIARAIGPLPAALARLLARASGRGPLDTCCSRRRRRCAAGVTGGTGRVGACVPAHHVARARVARARAR